MVEEEARRKRGKDEMERMRAEGEFDDHRGVVLEAVRVVVHGGFRTKEW